MSFIEDIITHKVFLGHPKNQSNPKTSQYRAGVYNGRVIFDPSAVSERLQHAVNIVAQYKNDKKNILILGDKELYKDHVVTIAGAQNVMYMNYKIPAGVVSNNETILGMIKTLISLDAYCQSDEFATLTKKEQSMKLRLLNKIQRVYAGVTHMKKKPDLIIILDGHGLSKFVHECELLKTPALVLSSSNFDRRTTLDFVPCNINSSESVKYVLSTLFS